MVEPSFRVAFAVVMMVSCAIAASIMVKSMVTDVIECFILAFRYEGVL
jgi:hypothetical protein